MELGLPGLNIHEIKGQDIADISNGRITLNSIEGIPLSEEWLNKCGFVIGIGQATGFYAGINGIAVQQAGNDWWVCLRGTEGYQLIRPVNFVHELQNIVFILTDQELQIKP